MPKEINYPNNPKNYPHWLIKRLKERAKGVHAQIFNLVEVAGVKRAHELYLQTLDIEATGGLKTKDGSRRRTIGGTYLYLAKKNLPEDIVQKIFFKFSSASRYQRDRIMDWSDRLDEIENVNKQGVIHEMKVTLVGQPGDITKNGNTVMMQMYHEFNYEFRHYPIGTPEAELPPTTYTVYMAEKEWEKVEQKLQNPQMALQVNGDCHFDPATQSMAVFTRHVKVQKAQTNSNKSASENNEATKHTKATTSKSDAVHQVTDSQSDKAGVKSSVSTNRMSIRDVEIEPLDLPDGVPDDVATKAQDMYTAICKFEEKISKLKASNQQRGIALTERLLQNTQNQLDVLLKPYL